MQEGAVWKWRVEPSPRRSPVSERGKRFIIEGEWSGYRSSQRRAVHRTVHRPREAMLRAWATKTRGIAYTDGTWLDLSVRDCKPRERVEEIHGYDRLIRECARRDVASVRALEEAENAARAVIVAAASPEEAAGPQQEEP